MTRARRIHYVLPPFALRDGSNWNVSYGWRDKAHDDRDKARAAAKRERRGVRVLHENVLPVVETA